MTSGRAGSRSRKLRAQIFNCKHGGQRVNRKLGEAMGSQCLHSVITPSTKAIPPTPSLNGAINWRPYAQVHLNHHTKKMPFSVIQINGINPS